MRKPRLYRFQKQITQIILLVFILLPITYSYAAVPHLINYQGRLTDSSGAPLNGSYNITFRIYDAETAGSLLWQEQQTGVVIQKGIFSVFLGSVTALDLPFDKQYFLVIQVGSDPEMSPRQRITSAGYAIRAETADNAHRIRASSADTTPGYLADKVDGSTIKVDISTQKEYIPFSTAQVVGTTDITTDNIEKDMPDMFTTFTTKGTRLLCEFTTAVWMGAENTLCNFYLYIDGNKVATLRGGTVSGTTEFHPLPFHLHWLATGLTPGTHTIKIRWHGTSNYGVRQYGTEVPRVLTAIDLP